MKTKEWKWDQYYEVTEIRRSGFSRLSDLDGAIDRVTGFIRGFVAAARAVYREVRELK